MKKIRYFLEYILLRTLFFLFKLIGLDKASALGGWIGRSIGPRLAASRKALANIRLALPDKTATEHTAILTGMWDNLGRVIAEYPHLEQIIQERVTLKNDVLFDRLRNDGQTAIFFGAHLGNWEVGALAIQTRLPTAALYRAPNNPAVARLLEKTRNITGDLKAIPKSRTGMREIFRTMKNGDHVGILIDQKYNEGLSLPFFGMPAMTSPAFVELAQKFKCPLIPVCMTRTKGAHFHGTLYETLELFDESGAPRAVETVIEEAHALLEMWIKTTPEQWLWLHRRWPGNTD